MRLATAFVAALSGASVASGFVVSPHCALKRSHSRKLGRTMGLSSAVATVNGDAAVEDIAESESVDQSIRLSVNEKARTVLSVCTSGTLCTKSSNEDIEGAPFGSFVDYVLDDEGNPVILMNEMSMHTVNVNDDPDGFVTLFTQLGQGAKGQDVSRCSVTGKLEKIDEASPDMDQIRMRYSITHSYADQVMDSPRFSFYRMDPRKLYFVGGFGVLAKWVPVEEYKDAAPDILAKEASEIVARLNRDNVDDLLLTAENLLDSTNVEKIRVTAVDRLGIDIRVTKRGNRANQLVTNEYRIGFRIPVISVEDAKSEVIKIFQESWEKENGVDWGDGEEPGSTIPILKIAEDGLGL